MEEIQTARWIVKRTDNALPHVKIAAKVRIGLAVHLAMQMADSAYWASPLYNRLKTLDYVNWAEEARRVIPHICMNTKSI